MNFLIQTMKMKKLTKKFIDSVKNFVRDLEKMIMHLCIKLIPSIQC